MKIKFVGPLASKLGKEVEIKVEGKMRVIDAIEELKSKFPQIRDDLSDLNFYNISINGQLLRHDEIEETLVEDKDEMVLIPAIAGGSKAVKIKKIIRKNFDASRMSYSAFEEKYGFFKALAKSLSDFLNAKGESCLDVGCGTGILGEVLTGWKITGIDISKEMVREASGKLEHVVVGDGERLPFRDDSFDAVLFNASIFLIPDAEKALEEAFRVVKPGGIVAGSYIYGLYHRKKDVLEELGLRHREVFPRERIDGMVRERNGEIGEIVYEMKREIVIDFYSIPAMSNALFPGFDYQERLRLVREKLSELPQKIEFVWKLFKISRPDLTN